VKEEPPAELLDSINFYQECVLGTEDMVVVVVVDFFGRRLFLLLIILGIGQ